MALNSTRKAILIVEDESSLRNALRDKFIREGYIVFDAKDGEVGRAIALREQPDIILLDMMMPKVDGMTMLKKLRPENEWSKTVPVLLLTNIGADGKLAIKEIAEDSRAHYLVKSNWPMSALVEKVRELTHTATLKS